MASESNEQPLPEEEGNEEDQFADSVADEGLSPKKVFKPKPTPTTDATDERGTQQSEGAAAIAQLSTSQTPSKMTTTKAVAARGPTKDYEATNQSTIAAAAAAFTMVSEEQPANQIPKLPPGVPLQVAPKLPKRLQQRAESADPPRKLPPGVPLTTVPQFPKRLQQRAESTDPPRGARLPPLSQAKQPPPPRNKETNKPANVPVIPISSIEMQVCKAARLVAVELSFGGWPEIKPGACFKAAAAIEEFAKTVFLPNLLHGGQQQHDNTEASNERIFLATMLALREALTQNAYRIFHIEDVRRDEQQLAGEPKPGSKRQKRLDYREERQYMAQLFGTGVIIASLQSLPEAESLILSFSATMDSYDTASDEFASRMNRLDGRHQGVMLNGKKLKKEENTAWKVSYNRARELHPVVCRNSRRIEQRSETPQVVQIPKPNALFVSMVEDFAKK